MFKFDDIAQDVPVTFTRFDWNNQFPQLLEMFGAGTACVVSPISSIMYKDQFLQLPTMEQEVRLFECFQKALTKIQYGYVEHPWAISIDDHYRNET